jgi:hypothetical protein
MPKVLNKYKDKIPKDAVYCGRGSKWGNPYIIGRDGTRIEVIELYSINVLPKFTEEELEELRGRDLVCFCVPNPCHCDLLLKEANK